MKLSMPFLLFSLLFSSPLVFAEADKSFSSPNKKEAQAHADTKAQEKANAHRQKILKEAVSAIEETGKAFQAIDKKNKKEALTSLKNATGQLEILIAREPSMVMAPFNVSVVTESILNDAKSIDKIKKEVVNLIEKDEVQKARTVLRQLASETRISVANIPLASYPAALKEAARLVDENKFDEAKMTLGSALSTVVVTQTTIPLPVLRADYFIQRAEKLSQKDNTNKDITKLIEASRQDLRVAQELGYGHRSEYDKAFSQLDKIKDKTEDGKVSSDLFRDVQSTIAKLYTDQDEIQAQEIQEE